VKTTSLPFKGSYTHSQSFGARPDVYAKYGLNGHDGDDWMMPENTPLYAPLTGKVINYGYDTDGWGKYIQVWDPVQSLIVNICHCNGLTVISPAYVTKGQLIGYSGNTGFSEAPHCHVACADTDNSGNRVNTNNGFKGWYSILDTSKISIDSLPTTTTTTPTTTTDTNSTPAPTSSIVNPVGTYYVKPQYAGQTLQQDRDTTGINGNAQVLASFLGISATTPILGTQAFSSFGALNLNDAGSGETQLFNAVFWTTAPTTTTPTTTPATTTTTPATTGEGGATLAQVSAKCDSILAQISQVLAKIGTSSTAGATTPQATGTATGTLFVTTNPDHASPYIDGAFSGDYTPFNMPFELYVGQHTLSIKKKGYKTINETITIVSGQSITKNYNLVAA
jgi:hypothetical protein